MKPRTYSTSEVAKLVKIHRITLQRWIRDGYVKASIEIPIEAGRIVRRWTRDDLATLKEYKAKNYIDTSPKTKKGTKKS
jgi:predicted site-specific integrase-resolvase